MVDDRLGSSSLAGNATRAILVRLCSHRTMTRIVDPVLADFQQEASELVAPGCDGVARAPDA